MSKLDKVLDEYHHDWQLVRQAEQLATTTATENGARRTRPRKTLFSCLNGWQLGVGNGQLATAYGDDNGGKGARRTGPHKKPYSLFN